MRKKVIIRKSKKEKLFLGCRVTNGGKAGDVVFLDEKKQVLLKLHLEPHSGFVPFRDRDFLPFFQNPFLVWGLSLLKPDECVVYVTYSIGGDSNYKKKGIYESNN